MSKKNPLVFLDVSIDGDPAERMVFELFSNAAPRTSENFRALCTGEKGSNPKTGRPLHYKGSFFHRIVKGLLAQGGDILNRDGTCEESIYGEKLLDDPISNLKHDERGMLTMAVADREMYVSLFSITFKPNHQLDRKHVVFGKLVQGYEVLEKIENVGDEDGLPSVTVKIVNCGEFFDEKKKREKLKRGKDGSSEFHEVNREGKRKKSSRQRRKRRKYYISESETSLDSETESSDSDSDSESSSLSSSSDDKRKKRKRSSKRDRYKHQKKRSKRHEKKRRKRGRKSKRQSKRASDTDSQSESSDDGDADVDGIKRSRKTSSEMIAPKQPSLAGDAFLPEKGTAERFEKAVEYPRENGDFQSNGIDLETKAERTADRPDVVDDHPGKSRSRSLSPKRSLSKSMSISHEKSLSPRQINKNPNFDKSPKLTSQRSRSISRSPVTGKKARSISRSPVRDVKRNLSRSPVKFSLVGKRRSSVRAPSRRSISKSPIKDCARSSLSRTPVGDRGRSLSRSPARDVKRSLSRSSVRDVKRSLSRSPMRDVKRSLSRSPGMVPSRRGKSRSPIRAHARRSYSRSPASDRGRSLSKSPRDESPKRIRRGRGFSQRFSYARRYRTPSPDRSPVRSYRYGRNDRERYRRSPRYNRSPPRDRTPLRNSPRRYRSPPTERSPVRRSPRRYRSPPRERSPLRYKSRKSRTRSPLSQSPARYRAESRTPPSRSRSPLITRPSPRPPSPKRANSDRSSSSSRSPVGNNNKGLVSYDDGSP